MLIYCIAETDCAEDAYEKRAYANETPGITPLVLCGLRTYQTEEVLHTGEPMETRQDAPPREFPVQVHLRFISWYTVQIRQR